MKLNKEQASKVIQQLNDNRQNRRPCSFCGNNNWIINDTIWELREFNNGNFVLGGDSFVMPIIAISCSKCGNTHFLNAIKLGVVESQSNNESSDETTK